MTQGRVPQFTALSDKELCEKLVKQAILTARSTVDPVQFQIHLGKLVEIAVDLLRHRS